MKKWQIENSEKSEISEISEKLFRVFLPYSQNRKLGFKNLGKKISEISEISEVSEFSTWPQKASVGLLQVFSQQIFSVNKLYYVVFQSFYCIQLFSAFFQTSRFLKVQVFQGPGFSGSRFFWVQIFQGPGFSGSRLFRVQVFPGPGPGSRSRFQKQPNICSERLSLNPEDLWSLSIQSRIYQCIDFVVTETTYYQGC